MSSDVLCRACVWTLNDFSTSAPNQLPGGVGTTKGGQLQFMMYHGPASSNIFVYTKKMGEIKINPVKTGKSVN